MERAIYKKLLDWKKRKNRKPLILLGARQVGKTYIMREFGRNEFANTIYLNCDRNEFAAKLFRDYDVARIISELEYYTSQKVIDNETLVIIDEIQEVAGGISSLKYFCEDRPSLHIIVAGSLLGISVRENESYPVGKVETIRMYPMTFSEFLLAKGKKGFAEGLDALDWNFTNTFHEQLISLLREYYFTGGMPAVLKEYIESDDTAVVRGLQSEILDAYIRDMGKHSKSQVQRIHMVWDSIPNQLSRENKKFIFGALKKGARAAEYEIAIQWLADAGIIHKVNRTKSPQRPLKFYADNSAFKIYLSDCGLLSCLCHAPAKDLLLGTSAFTEYKGALTENYVLQQIRAITDNSDVFYFAKDNSTQEIDFLVETENRIIPIEVKAEENVKSKSLYGFINVDHIGNHLKGLRISMKPYIDQGWMENIPLYAVEAYIRKEQGLPI